MYLVSKQSHYREVSQWEIFMEQEVRFGWLTLMKKKIRADYEQLLRPFFQIFVVKEELKIKNIAASALESCIK